MRAPLRFAPSQAEIERESENAAAESQWEPPAPAVKNRRGDGATDLGGVASGSCVRRMQAGRVSSRTRRNISRHLLDDPALESLLSEPSDA